MKTSILSALVAASAYTSPLLANRQSCPASGITAAWSTEVLNKFKSAQVVPDSVPRFTPTTDLRVKYGNINENLGNSFTVIYKPAPAPDATTPPTQNSQKHSKNPSSPSTQKPTPTRRPQTVVHRRADAQDPPNYTSRPLELVEDVVRAPFDLQKYVTEGGLVLVGGNFMREGLMKTLCAVVPGCSATGQGYTGPRDGKASPDIRKYVEQ
ncbi:uncharacterized protein M421DRAFT_9031 [Didymella exigua CBS 183.55]|uniref:Uncharacterized protein n=1 Tax=Didymella exigua CBS 183.55 TaxID=1150837 RepID=A0A6A5RAW3_9PLEO|nr:uncharacterized protein M421DRAFT_9031 [Didymella exigua CBS 183.55]KAF1924204.1 hypothetical protein M421DRAFT_9031 [Didymella exigua CBS 183.55]